MWFQHVVDTQVINKLAGVVARTINECMQLVKNNITNFNTEPSTWTVHETSTNRDAPLLLDHEWSDLLLDCPSFPPEKERKKEYK